MPLKLDEVDIALLESLIKDGRKSFRQISREIKVSSPTVKARYDPLVNVGLIKGVLPVLDLGKLEPWRSVFNPSLYHRRFWICVKSGINLNASKYRRIIP